MSVIASLLYFVFDIFFSLALFSLWARIIINYLRISPRHPARQMIFSLTNTFLSPFEKWFNSHLFTRIDTIAFITVSILSFLKVLLFGLFLYGQILPIAYLLLLTLGDLLIQPCNLFFYLVLARILFSWFHPNQQNPLVNAIYLITEPLYQWGYRFISRQSGFDFAPLLILLSLKLITVLIRAALPLHLL